MPEKENSKSQHVEYGNLGKPQRGQHGKNTDCVDKRVKFHWNPAIPICYVLFTAALPL